MTGLGRIDQSRVEARISNIPVPRALVRGRARGCQAVSRGLQLPPWPAGCTYSTPPMLLLWTKVPKRVVHDCQKISHLKLVFSLSSLVISSSRYTADNEQATLCTMSSETSNKASHLRWGHQRKQRPCVCWRPVCFCAGCLSRRAGKFRWVPECVPPQDASEALSRCLCRPAPPNTCSDAFHVDLPPPPPTEWLCNRNQTFWLRSVFSSPAWVFLQSHSLAVV